MGRQYQYRRAAEVTMAKKRIMIQPYAIPLTYTNSYKEFNALSASDKADGTECGMITDAALGGYVLGVFDKNLATLVHECGHAAIFVCNRVGIPITGDCEAFCYLLDYLFTEGRSLVPYVSVAPKEGAA